MNNSLLFKKHGIDFLTHFTSIYNLESILNNGILSVENMKKNNIKYVNTDKNRFDAQLNYISVSTNIINKRMLYKKEHNNTNNLNIWIILVLDLSLLDNSNNNIYYCYKNAATSEINFLLKTNKEKLIGMDSIKSFLTSDDIQKEILFENKIDKNYIKCIVVKNQNDRDIVKSIVSSLNINIPVICKNEMF